MIDPFAEADVAPEPVVPSRRRIVVVSPDFGLMHRGSFLQTRDGFVAGLRANGEDVALWTPAEDLGGEGTQVPLRGARAIVYFGPPLATASWLRLAILGGAALGVPVFWMLAANSLTLPAGVRSFLRRYPTLHILTPSTWSSNVIANVLAQLPEIDPEKREVWVVPHGVEVPPDVPVTDPRWCHLVAGVSGRKGTEELLAACGTTIPLCVYADALAFDWVTALAEDQPNVEVRRGYDGSVRPTWWGHAGYVQPSRAEGFGICAVEAALLGRTVAMTAGTGEPSRAISNATHLYLVRGSRSAWSVANDPTWEGGDGPFVHDVSNFWPLRIMRPTTIRRVLLAASLLNGHPRPGPNKGHPHSLGHFAHKKRALRFLENLAWAETM